MPANVAIRLSVEGGAELRRSLDDAGRAGQDAFRGIGAAADQASAATDKLTQRAQQAAQAARAGQNGTGGGAAPVSMPAPAPTTSREIERIRNALDEDYRKRNQLDRAGSGIERGFRAGHLDDVERTRLLDLASQRYGTAPPRNDNIRGLDSRDRGFIQYSAFSGVSSLTAGASLSTVAAQQGTGIVQLLADREGGLKAGLADVGATAARMVTPLTVAGTAVAALGVAFGVAAAQASRDQTALEAATQGLGRRTGATVSQLDELAKSNAEAGKVSTSTAREIAAGYASTGNIAIPVIGNLISRTSEYARLTGQDVPSATAELAKAFSDPAQGADFLASRIGGLDDKTRQLINTQAEQGDRAGAQATQGEFLKRVIDANAASTSGWAAQWDKVKVASDGAWESFKKWSGNVTGLVPERAEERAERLGRQVEGTNDLRRGLGMGPLGLGDQAVIERDTARLVADGERRANDAKAAEDRASAASIAAGNIARSIDPRTAQLSGLIKQQSDLRDALADPLARRRLDDLGQTETAYLGVSRAIASITDANGKLISSEEMARRQDQLAIDSAKAKTTAEKAAIAERQKDLELAGQLVTPSDARARVARAGLLSRAQADAKGGSGSESADEYERAVKSLDDRSRRLSEEATTYGQGAEAVARYRAEQDLLVAAKRAERDLTPSLVADIKQHADAAADAAKRVEDVRESSRRTDEYRSVGSDGVRTLVRDLADGAKAGRLLDDVLGSLKSRVADLAATSLNDALFGRRGSSDTGALGGLLSGLFRPDSAGTAAASASSTSGLFSSLRSLLGFAEGGFTGFSDRGAIAGFVHGREYVFDAEATSRIGVRNLDAMRRGARGYSDGGFVGSKAFAGNGSRDRGPPSITFVTPPGMSLEADGPPKRRADGGYEQVLKTVEEGLAGRAANGRGPLKQSVGGAWARNG